MALASPPSGSWKNVMMGSNYDPNNDQQSSADSDLLGNSSNAMMQAQSVAITGDTVYYYRVRVGTLANGNASSSFYLALDLNGTGSFPTADMFVEARYSIIGGNLKKAAVVFHKADFSGSNSGYSPSTTAWQSSSNNDNIEYSLLGGQGSANSYSNVNAFIGQETTGSNLDGDGNNDLWITFGFTLSQLNAWAKAGISGGGNSVAANNIVSTTVTGNSAMALFAFTSTSQTANGDIAGVNDATANLNQSWTDLGLVINTTLDNLGSGAPASPSVNLLTTADTTPVVSGLALLSSAYTDTLTVLINGQTYSVANGNLTLTRVGTTDTYQWAVQVATALTSGTTYDVTATTTRSGSTSATDKTAGELVIDSTLPPQLPTITSYADDVSPNTGNFGTGTSTNDLSPKIQGVLDLQLGAGDSLHVYRSTAGGTFTDLGTATVSGTNWYFQDTGLANGSAYLYKAAVVNGAKTGVSSNLLNLSVDTTAPTATLGITSYYDDVGASTGNFSSGTTTDDNSYSIIGSFPSWVSGQQPLANGEKVAVYRDAAFVGYGQVTPTVDSTGNITGYTWSFQENGLTQATYVYTAKVVDAAGNAGTLSSNFSVTVSLPIDVSSITLNERSSYAVFTVKGTSGQTATLSVASGSATGTALSTDAGSDFVTTLQYSTDGSTWSNYSTSISFATSTTVYVRVPIVYSNVYEGPETFTLSATSAGTTAIGTATIMDNGTGNVLTGTVSAGVLQTSGTAYDDRSIAVASYSPQSGQANDVVNEASNYAFFTVTATANEVVLLNALDSNSGGYTANLGTTPALFYSLNNGLTWLAYDAASGISVPSGGEFKVRLSIVAEQDAIADNNESFALKASYSTNTSKYATKQNTINDDGTGTIYLVDGTIDTTTTKDTDIAPTTTVTIASMTRDSGAADFLTNDGAASRTVSGALSVALGSNEILEISFDGGTTWSQVTTFADATHWTATDSGTHNANWTIQARVKNTFNTMTGSVASQAVTLDTSAPAVAITSITDDTGTAADYRTSDTTLIFGGTNEAGATVAVTLDGVALGSATVSGTGWTYNNTASTLAEGNHTLSVTATDAAGNTRTATQVIVIDTTAPAVAITSITNDTGTSADYRTSDATLIFGGTNETGATVAVTLDGVALGSATVSGTGWTYNNTASTLAEGNHTLSVTATDAAGNTSTATQIITIDTSITAPTVALSTDSTDGVTNNNSDLKSSSAALTFNSKDADATRVFVVDGGSSSGTYTAPTAQGSHTVTVTDTDTAGNTANASITFVLDTIAPVLSTATVNGTSLVLTYAEAGVGMSGKTPAASDYAVSVNGTSVTPSAVSVNATNKTVTLTLPSSVNSGDTVTASYTGGVNKIQDIAGNLAANLSNQAVTNNGNAVAPSTTVTIASMTLDSGAADFLTNDGAANRTVSGALSVALGANEILEVSFDGGSTWSQVSTFSDATHWSITDPGTHNANWTIQARVKNTSSTLTGSVASQAVTLDTTISAPTVALSTDSTDGVTNNNSDLKSSSAALTFNSKDADATRVFVVDGGSSSGTYTAPTAQGSHTVTVTDTDTAGNTANASITFVLDTIAPVLSTATVNGTSLVLTYAEAGVGMSGKTPAASDYAVSVNGTSVTPSAVSVNATNKTVTLTLSSAVIRSDTVLVSYTASANKVQDIAGNLAINLSSASVSNDTPLNVVSITSVTDDVAPLTGTLANPGISNDTNLRVRVNLTGSGALAGDTLKLYDGVGVSAQLGINYTLTSSDIANGFADVQTGLLSNGQTYTITARLTDPQNNQSLVSSNSFVETIDTSITAPTVALSTDSTDGVTNNNSDLKSSSAALTFNSKDADATRVFVVDGGSSSGTYTAPTAQGSHTVTVTDTDTAGNTANASITFVLDTVAPVLSTATVNGTSLVLTYAEAGVGMSGKTPAASDYAVSVNGTSVTPSAVSVNATNKTVTLTLPSSVNSGDTVAASYTAGVNKIQDIAGNLSISFSAAAVTNTTASPPPSSNTPEEPTHPTPTPPPPPPPPPPFTANLDPAKDTGALDNVTKDAKPEFTLNGGAYLQPGRTAQLLDPTGAIVGKSSVTPADISAGKVNVPTPLLDDGTYTYTAQILDETGKVVASAPVTVTIVTDLDGVMPSVELAAKGGDSNGDGVPDWQQNNVAQLPMSSVEDYLKGKAAPQSSFGSVIAGSLDASSPSGVKLQPTAQLENIRIVAMPSQPLPNNAVAQSPLLDFTVTSQTGSSVADLDTSRPGLQLQTVILLPANVTANAYMKYDRTSGQWTNLTNPASINGSQDGAALIDSDGDGRVDRIVITITDGGPGDEDGIANGRVVDPGALALVPPLITGPSGPEGSAISEKSIPENTLPVASFKASEPVTWSISGGNDRQLFAINTAGQLVFNNAPDYEAPVDSNHDNAYLIQIKATNLQGNSNVQDVTIKVTDVLDERVPIFAAATTGTDRWLSLSQSQADVIAAKSGTKAQIDFYGTKRLDSDTLHLSAWQNVLTGDYFYAPDGVAPPYACYVKLNDVELGRVLKPGKGAFDVHLYLNADGLTQLVGTSQATQMGLLSHGYSDLGALFASAPVSDSPVGLVGVMPIA